MVSRRFAMYWKDQENGKLLALLQYGFITRVPFLVVKKQLNTKENKEGHSLLYGFRLYSPSSRRLDDKQEETR